MFFDNFEYANPYKKKRNYIQMIKDSENILINENNIINQNNDLNKSNKNINNENNIALEDKHLHENDIFQ